MSKDLNDLREALFNAITDVRAGTLPLDKARAINEIGKTIVDTAKVEVDYIRATDGKAKSKFIPAARELPQLPGRAPANGIEAAVDQLTGGTKQ
jgi:hypothetical protein